MIELLSTGNTHEEILFVLKSKGYTGSRCSISAYMSRKNITTRNIKRKINLSNDKVIESIHVNKVIKCICKNIKNLTSEEKENLKKLNVKFPELVKLKELIDEFKAIFLFKEPKLQDWIIAAKAFNIIEIDSYIKGIKKDNSAVENSIVIQYNNGLLEGTVNKIKGIKRIGNGRCKFDLLRTRVLNSQEIYG